jgi:hypothetical protein
MNVADFHTAVNHNLPLTAQGRHDLIHKGLPPKYAEVVQPDFENLVVGFADTVPCDEWSTSLTRL